MYEKYHWSKLILQMIVCLKIARGVDSLKMMIVKQYSAFQNVRGELGWVRNFSGASTRKTVFFDDWYFRSQCLRPEVSQNRPQEKGDEGARNTSNLGASILEKEEVNGKILIAIPMASIKTLSVSAWILLLKVPH